MEQDSEQKWKDVLTPDEFHILRLKGTEPAFSGEYNDNKEKGMYLCRGCGAELFSSVTKFDSGSGWPSFFQPISESAVEETRDARLEMKRTEVLCKKCGGHLGHVFPDGLTHTKEGKPATGLRYCINSTALNFKKESR